MNEFVISPLIALANWEEFFRSPALGSLLKIFVFVTVGFFIIILLSIMASRLLTRKGSRHVGVLVQKFIFYAGTVILLLTVLLELGFDLTGLLATAGIATVAIGFAAQTSLSNLISGLFLIGEKPFQIGDLIRVNETLGIVESIDLLSIKIRTMDNLFVRIPNESMIKSPFTNVTRYPIRRMDLDIGVAYKEDVGQIMEVLKELAENNPYVLMEPEPLILFNNFGESALEFRLGLWFEKSNFLKLRNSILREIKERFDAEGIEIPFPHVTVYTGSRSEPFPVQLQKSQAEQAPQNT